LKSELILERPLEEVSEMGIKWGVFSEFN